MKVKIKKQISNLSNQDIKWYLSDEKLWITKHQEYAEVEKSIKYSKGSFNWLYEINDTVLFNEKNGNFETAIIDLSGKIKTGDMNDFFKSIQREEKGELFLTEEMNCNFEYPPLITYVKKGDYMVSVSTNSERHNLSILYIVNDFGFIIMNNQLEGWVLKNASKHICVSQKNEKTLDENPELLEIYLKALNLWEANEENVVELKKLLVEIKAKNDVFSLALKESIMNILS